MPAAHATVPIITNVIILTSTDRTATVRGGTGTGGGGRAGGGSPGLRGAAECLPVIVSAVRAATTGTGGGKAGRAGTRPGSTSTIRLVSAWPQQGHRHNRATAIPTTTPGDGKEGG